MMKELVTFRGNDPRLWDEHGEIVAVESETKVHVRFGSLGTYSVYRTELLPVADKTCICDVCCGG